MLNVLLWLPLAVGLLCFVLPRAACGWASVAGSAAALGISIALIADSLDFLEDAAINLLIFAGIGWSVRNRARLGVVLAGILLVPGLATAWAAWQKFADLTPPEPVALTLTGLHSLQARGLSDVLLYVDESNVAAVKTYTRLGFERHATDVLYRRG